MAEVASEGLHTHERERASSEMIINPHGARIELLRLGGRDLLTTVTRGDGKAASTHPCTPIFGLDKKNLYGLNRHGDSRNEDFGVLASEPNRVILTRNIQEGRYPHGMNIWQEYKLENGLFRLKTVHTNTGTQKAPVVFAHHLYLNTPDGWDGTLVNDEDVTNYIKHDAVRPLQRRNVIKFPGQSPIIMTQQGMPFVNYWVGQEPVQEGQEPKYDEEYAAIEPAEADPDSFGQSQTMIYPGESRETEIIISV